MVKGHGGEELLRRRGQEAESKYTLPGHTSSDPPPLIRPHLATPSQQQCPIIQLPSVAPAFGHTRIWVGGLPDINRNTSIWVLIQLSFNHSELLAVSWSFDNLWCVCFVCFIIFPYFLPQDYRDFSGLMNSDYSTVFLMFCLESHQAAAPILGPAMARGREGSRGGPTILDPAPGIGGQRLSLANEP